eukprot:8418790-Pyramimonas_sp.AAC.1
MPTQIHSRSDSLTLRLTRSQTCDELQTPGMSQASGPLTHIDMYPRKWEPASSNCMGCWKRVLLATASGQPRGFDSR